MIKKIMDQRYLESFFFKGIAISNPKGGIGETTPPIQEGVIGSLWREKYSPRRSFRRW